MIHYIKALEAKINLYIREVESEEINLMNRSLSIANKLEEAIGGLKAFIKTYSFKDIREEILFFKEIKPRIHCRLIYYRKVYNLELNRPLGGMTNHQNYFQWELEHIQEYINKHLDFYRYYRSGATYMDEIYFVRGTKPVSNMYLDSLIYGCDGYWRFWSVLNKCKNRQSNPHIRYYKMGRNYMTIMICVGCFMSVSVRYSDIVLNMDYPTKC